MPLARGGPGQAQPQAQAQYHQLVAEVRRPDPHACLAHAVCEVASVAPVQRGVAHPLLAECFWYARAPLAHCPSLDCSLTGCNRQAQHCKYSTAKARASIEGRGARAQGDRGGSGVRLTVGGAGKPGGSALPPVAGRSVTAPVAAQHHSGAPAAQRTRFLP